MARVLYLVRVCNVISGRWSSPGTVPWGKGLRPYRRSASDSPSASERVSNELVRRKTRRTIRDAHAAVRRGGVTRAEVARRDGGVRVEVVKAPRSRFMASRRLRGSSVIEVGLATGRQGGGSVLLIVLSLREMDVGMWEVMRSSAVRR